MTLTANFFLASLYCCFGKRWPRVFCACVSALSGTRALQLRNAREARGGKKKSSRDEHGVLEGPRVRRESGKPHIQTVCMGFPILRLLD